MLTKLLLSLSDVSPFARRHLWRWWYERMAKRIRFPGWTFMNYGLVPPLAGATLSLESGDEADRLCIQLYHRVISGVSLERKEVLEIGAGRGGGASFVARYHHPARMTAFDYSPQAVKLCLDRHHVPNLEFKVGDAEKIPVGDASHDALINVESSHCYGSIETFFREVARVLRPGGTFLYADFRGAQEMSELKELLAEREEFEMAEQEDITAMVAAAMQADHERKRAVIAELIPARQRPVFEEFAGVAGGQVHTRLANRQMLYQRFVLRKKSAL